MREHKLSDPDFWDKEAKYYDGGVSSYGKNNPNLKVISSLKPNNSVLLLGCGGGREVSACKKSGLKITAIDYSKQMIKQSKLRVPNAKYYCTDAIKFVKECKDKFDYILGLFNFLNAIYFDDHAGFIKDCMKILKPNGKMFFEVRLFGRCVSSLYHCLKDYLLYNINLGDCFYSILNPIRNLRIWVQFWPKSGRNLPQCKG